MPLSAIRATTRYLSAALMVTFWSWGGILGPQAQPPLAPPLSALLPVDASYLELSSQPSLVLPGTLFTLTVAYHNLGLPYTNIYINPANLAFFDPPISQPCTTGCTTFTLRAQAPGVVALTASATGEIFDATCGCWYWGSAADNGPARVVIAETIWQTFLPTIQQPAP